ncbi:MAG: ankyrin repeat domain-containing protein [Maribacter sp.]
MKKSISIFFLASIFTVFGSYANMAAVSTDTNLTLTVNDDITALCEAAMKGDVEKVRSLIALGEELNEKSKGLTPAMYAARYNKAEVLKVLMLNGANMNIKSDKGYTAKDYASMSNAKDVMQVIESAK